VESLEKKLQLKTESGQLDLQISRSNERYYRNRMDALQDAIDTLTVRAPVSGVVIYKRDFNGEAREIGSNIFAMDAIMEIPDLSSLRARIQIDEIDSGKIKVGNEANIAVDSVQGRSFNGVVTSIGTILKQANFERPQKSVDAYINLKDPDTKVLRPGMSLKSNIKVGQDSQVIVLPLSSIVEKDGRSFVQVWQPKTKTFELREIQSRSNNDGLTAIVESGLNANDKIRTRPKV